MRITPQIHRFLSQSDPQLAQYMRDNRLPQLTVREDSPYVSLLRSIMSQQISTTAARAIGQRFFALFNGNVDFEHLHSMPDSTLRTVGLSRQKILYMRDLATRVISGQLPPEDDLTAMPDDEVIENLTTIKGVGVWTVQMLLIFHFHRPDVWPVGDLGIRRGFKNVHRRRSLPQEKYLFKFGAKFGPYRTYAARYYWLAAH